MKKSFLLFFVCLPLLLPASLFAGESIRMASTTSTLNSGILEYLIPLFRAKSGVEIQVIAVTNSEALELGKQGKVDCVLVHAENLEKQFVEAGFFVDREKVMYNDFVLLGPVNDPAGIKTTKKVTQAFKKIRETGAYFASRADNSDTNMLENRIWARTGKMPSRSDKWYLSTGQTQAQCIRLAAEKQGYTFSDRATWLAIKAEENINLNIVLEGDPSLFNQYGVMIVNPAKHKDIDYRLAMNFAIWLTSPEGQHAIAEFRDKYGNTLFTPNAPQ